MFLHNFFDEDLGSLKANCLKAESPQNRDLENVIFEFKLLNEFL